MPANYPNLMDAARRSGNSSISSVIEVLNQSNSLLDDLPWTQCNSGSTHITTIRTGIPTPAWRRLNAGVDKVKSHTRQITAYTGMLEAYSEVDEELVSLIRRGQSGQEGAANYLASENSAVLEGFAQEVSRVLFYGDPAKIDEPVGLVNYYNSTNSSNCEAAKNVITAGGSGADNTSVWFVQFGDRGVSGIYPEGTTAGFQEDYLGIHTVEDANNKQFQAHRTHYKWKLGIVQRDWRRAVRICNLDVSDLEANNNSAANLLQLFTKAFYKLPTGGGSLRTCIYCRKEVLTALDLQVQNKSNLLLNYTDVAGRPVLNWRGIPIKEQESLLTSETLVS